MSAWTSERGRVAALTRSRTPNDPDLLTARQRLKAERLAVAVAKAIEEAPPLTTEQRERIAALLKEGVTR